MNYELIEDVLDKEIYEEINKKFNSSFFPWFYNDSTIPGADNNFMFTHHIYRNGQISSEYFNDILPVLFEVGITTGKSKYDMMLENFAGKQLENFKQRAIQQEQAALENMVLSSKSTIDQQLAEFDLLDQAASVARQGNKVRKGITSTF